MVVCADIKMLFLSNRKCFVSCLIVTQLLELKLLTTSNQVNFLNLR